MTNDKLILFLIQFTADIVGATRAMEDPRNICLSEPLAPIMKFPTHDESRNISASYKPLEYNIPFLSPIICAKQSDSEAAACEACL